MYMTVTQVLRYFSTRVPTAPSQPYDELHYHISFIDVYFNFDATSFALSSSLNILSPHTHDHLSV